jgi:molecular chaperone DnaJ
MAGKDYYKTLNVSENASKDEIKKAYRRLAKKYHPDANKDNPEAEAKFKEVSEAYGVLNDPRKRQQYDQLRKYGGGFGAGAGSPFGQGAPQGGFGGYGQGGSFRMDDFDLGSFGDLFSSIFGDRGARTHRRKSARRRPVKGTDLRITLPVSFREAALGTKKTIRYKRDENCPRCNGTGAEPGSGQTTCPKCNGSGMYSMSQGMFSISRPCPQCFGTGQIAGKPCGQCNATGKMQIRKTVNIRIPAGIESGKKIRLRQMGNAGPEGMPEGDLIITVSVKPDRFFRRSGLDVFCDVPLSLSQAHDGTKIKVRTLSGKAMLTIPSLTKDGSLFKLKGQGINDGKAVGDQYVKVKVRYPKKPSEEEQRMIDEIEGKAEPKEKTEAKA